LDNEEQYILKTLHITKMTSIGLAFLISGLFLLGVSFYLYEIDLQFNRKIHETPINPAYMGGPIHLSPYYYLQPTLNEIGIILIGIVIFLLFYTGIKNRIKQIK
jgi:hypothetical protein